MKRGIETPGVGVGALVHNYKGYLLMLQRTGAHGAGQWTIPGGWMEHGESPINAAKREVMEETGVDVMGIKLVGVTNDVHPEGVHSVTLFISCITSLEPLHPEVMEPDKALRWAWVKYPLVSSLDLFLPVRQFVDQGGFDGWVGGQG